MEKELLNSDKELLLKDICGRLPYGVKGILCEDGVWTLDRIWTKKGYESVVFAGDYYDVDCFKPYLFPLSSMTPKQKAELSILVVDVEDIFKSFLIEVEFYHKHHIDYRGFIEKGLAIDATGLNIY